MNNMDVLNDNKLDLDIEAHLETLGEFLRYHREQKLVSLEELSMKTKIRIQQLVNLEQNNFMELPNAVYLKGFIKSICNELDVNVELALNYLNDNRIAETAIEDALEFLTPGNEIKKLPFDFKFFDRSKIKVNQKLLVASVAAIAIGGSFIGNLRLNTKKAEPAIIHTKMNFIEAKKLIQPDAVTDLAPPEGLGYTVQTTVPGEAVPVGKTMMNNDMIDGKKVIAEPKMQASTEVQSQVQSTPATQPAVQPNVPPVVQQAAQPIAKTAAPVVTTVTPPAATAIAATNVVTTATPVQPAAAATTATTAIAATNVVTTATPVQPAAAATTATTATAPATSPTKLAVTAKKATAFLVYRVNGEKKNKIYLRRGKTLELEGNEIRMDVGNPGAVEFTKNGEPYNVKAEPGQPTLHIEI